MAKIKNVSADTKAAIRRKSAYTLPNNPTDSGYKADDIRKAFWQPIVDISQSAIAEIERVVDDINAIFERSVAGIATISSVAGEYYHSNEGFIYTLSDEKFTISGYEGEETEIEIPTEVLYDGVKYEVSGIASGAFSGVSTVLLTNLITIESGAFSAGTSFTVPKEYIAEYKEMLSGFTVLEYHTITSNEERISDLENDKLNKVTGENSLTRVYIISTSGAQLTKEITQTPSEGKLSEYRTNGRLGVGTPTADDDAVPKLLLDTELAKRGAFIAFDIDPSTFIMTLALKNIDGSVLDTKSVDLPLETMIIGASYEKGVIYLTVKGEDEPLAVDISDLIDGLVNESTFRTEVDRLDRQDALNVQDISSIRTWTGLYRTQ